MPGEGNAQQALYWQVSDDAGEAWTPPRPVLPPYLSPAGQQLPYWSPVLHMQARRAHNMAWNPGRQSTCSRPYLSP